VEERDLTRFEALRRAAHEVTRDWSRDKAAIAVRAAGIGSIDGPRESLEAIAADSGVSRETVRRARNELLATLEARSAAERPGLHPRGRSRMSQPPVETPATARALRRLLTMTGPLPWDEVLRAWARAGGKHPYTPLRTDIASLRVWAQSAGGFVLTPDHDQDGPVTVAVETPEDLDRVSVFLYETLCGWAAGIDRVALLEAADSAGLKSTTIATALSHHPAVMRLGRGTWALRGQRDAEPADAKPIPAPRQVHRGRPTSFGWADDGSLIIEFSIPRGPSPVVAVPRAVADLVEEREFVIEGHRRPVRVAIGNARLWGFGPLVSELGLSGGQRAQLLINLLAGTASLNPVDRGETR
jgi:hypothetical protein